MHGPMNVRFVNINYYCSFNIETYSEESLTLVRHVCSHKTNLSQNKNNCNAEDYIYIYIYIYIYCHKVIELFSLLHRACCQVTQLLYQPLHIYKIYKIFTLKH